jgi:LacI family transcriptional regulator, galactose operon repressor
MSDVKEVILLVESARGFGRGLLRGIVKFAFLQGPWRFCFRPSGQEIDIPSARKLTADGIIAHVNTIKKLDKLVSLGIPCIAATPSPNPGQSVFPIKADSAMIGKMGAKHFLDRGFTNFAFSGFDDLWYSLERGKSFGRTIRKAGFQVEMYLRPSSRKPSSWDQEQVLLSKWLKSLKKPLALMATNDDEAQSIAEACKFAGFNVPEEVAILGVDNDEFVCELSNPPISSIAINSEKAGYEAANLLNMLMLGDKPQKKHVLIQPTHVFTRQSTDILAIEDKEVALALNFIRNKNTGKLIQVSDIAAHVVTSRRSLERKFKNVLGRSVNDEIRHVRTELIAKLLIETNMSVSQIAYKLGYPRVDHISRYFRKDRGITPLEFRKRYT